MFQWTARHVALPVGAPAKTQRAVQVDVRVTEQTSPCYALVFSVVPCSSTELLGTRVERRVTKQHMTQVFEQVVSRPMRGVATMRTRKFDAKTASRATFDDAVDRVVLMWLQGTSKQAPTREQLVLWLLSRMMLQCSQENDDSSKHRTWVLVLHGEGAGDQGDDISIDGEVNESAVLLPPPSSPLPPPYSADGAECGTSDLADFSDDGRDNGDEGVADDPDEIEDQEQDNTNDGNHCDTQQVAGQRSAPGRAKQSTPTIRRSSSGSSHERQHNSNRKGSTSDDADDARQNRTPSQYRFEPASTRRRSSLSSTRSSNAWTEERQHFQLELSLSKRDIDAVQQRQHKALVIATLQRQQLIAKSHQKLLAYEQKLRDARFVKQSIADTLEYHAISHRLESQLKQTKISATREQDRLAQSMRVALGRSGDTWQKGAVLGAGPLSQIEIDLLTSRRSSSKSNSGSRDQSAMWVYDLHGRRHSGRDAGTLASESAFESAMNKIQVLLARKGTASVELFRTYDRNANGTLEYAEFERLLQENRVVLTQDQATTLFAHFDPNCSGAIDYGELLWGFFNRRAFLKRWQLRKTNKLTAREIKMRFYKYDRVGRGALSPTDFQLALADIGFRVSESETQLLCLKFDANRDGYIDYNEFHAFVNDKEEDEEGGTDREAGDYDGKDRGEAAVGHRQDSRSVVNRSRQTVAINPNARVGEFAAHGGDMHRILAELRALSETHEEIQRAIAR